MVSKELNESVYRFLVSSAPNAAKAFAKEANLDTKKLAGKGSDDIVEMFNKYKGTNKRPTPSSSSDDSNSEDGKPAAKKAASAPAASAKKPTPTKKCSSSSSSSSTVTLQSLYTHSAVTLQSLYSHSTVSE